MAKKKEQEQAQVQSFKDMSPAELTARLTVVEENRFRLQFRHASSSLKNPMQIRQARREIARIKTALTQKAKGTV